MDFRSYQKTHETKTDNTRSKEDIRKKAEEYGKKSDSELLDEIKRAAQEGKANGSLTDNKLQAFASQVAPLLNEEQRERLNGVIAMLRD